MKQKLLLLATILCSAFTAQAVDWRGEEITSGNKYYLYNPSAGVFLNSNGSVGTSPVDQWTITFKSNTYEIKSDNNYICLYLKTNNGLAGVGAGLEEATATSGPKPSGDGVFSELNYKVETSETNYKYQFYHTKSWRPSITTHYATGFLTASETGIGCSGIDHGRDNPGTPSCNEDNSWWYMVSINQYDSAPKTDYYYKVTASATIGCSAFLSFSDVATSGESTLANDVKQPTKPNNVTMYAKATPPNAFYEFVGWKTSEDATEYVSRANPYKIDAEYIEGTSNDNATISLIAEFTQIFTDPPTPGKYVLYNPATKSYMTSIPEYSSFDTNPNNATVYTLTNKGSGSQQESTLTFNDGTYLAYHNGNHANGTEEFTWLIIKQDNGGYRLQHSSWETNTDFPITVSRHTRRISTWQENNDHGICFPQFDILDGDYSEETDETTWLFFTEDHWRSVIENENNYAVLAVNATVGYGTFVAPFDVTLPAGVTAYTVTGFEGSTLTLNKVADPQGTLAANTAVVLESSLGNDIVETVVAVGEAYGVENAHSGDYLVGTYEKTPAPQGSYLLQYQNNHAAFFLVDGTNTLYSGKNRAYLTNVPQESSKGVKAFSLNGSETAIDEVIILNEDTAIYDLSGRRLSKKPARGLYIQNGKKILVK